ncbi:hypothetical protein ACFPVX_09295 [Cohnella faecalis]|uniref:Uncharacterized protein n=1 Tax=Cohnella faecalis TaxID=2315694 RepID=A0A398CLZ3_9BACL|nr:hypothetical protein [Cohnella faecalis]RIE01888.1 hypothetical protein D3H35_13990 [Cohnella faecalis]
MMKKRTPRLLAAAVFAAVLTLPAVANAASAEPAAVAAPALKTKFEAEGAFAALQIGEQVHVYNKDGQLFKTKGPWREGDLKDLFILPYGPEQIPFVLIQHDKYGYMVFSDLWPKFAKGKEKDTEEAYYSGRIFYKAQTRIDGKTRHHYAIQKGDEVITYIANDFDNLKKGYHEGYRVKGKLRGLVLYDCCPYTVVDSADGKLSVYHAGEKGATLSGHIDLK